MRPALKPIVWCSSVPETRERELLIVQRHAPWDGIRAMEGLEAALAAGAFEAAVRVAFLDEGVWQLKRDQDGAALGLKHFPAMFGALGEFGIRALLVEREALAERGLQAENLIAPVASDGSPLLEIHARRALADRMRRQTAIIGF